jgi:hypothetical protein
VQSRDFGAECIAPVVLPADQACMFERGQQPQRRALVELRALGELRKRQRLVARLESREQAQCAVDRSRAAGGGIEVGNRFGLGFAGHGSGLTGKVDRRSNSA